MKQCKKYIKEPIIRAVTRYKRLHEKQKMDDRCQKVTAARHACKLYFQFYFIYVYV